MSEATANTVCPHCHRATDPGRFCQCCGKRLTDAPAAPAEKEAAPAAPPPAPAIRIQKASDASEPRIPPPPAAPTRSAAGATAVEWDPVAPAAAPVRPSAGHRSFAADPPDAPDACPIDVEYNFARAFVVGQIYPFQFRIRAPRTPLRAVRISFSGDIGGNTLPGAHTVPFQIGAAFVPIQVNFAPKAETFGEPAFTVTFECQCAHASEWRQFQTTVNHRIYPASVKAADAARSLVVNIRNNIQNQGHAVDIQTNSALDNLAHLVGQGDPTQAMHTLINVMSEKAIFRPLQLIPANRQQGWRNRLTLLRGDTTLHVLDGESVSFGRRSTNHVVLRAFHPGGTQDRNASSLISGHHFRLDFDGHRCVLRDGGRDPVAAAGPFLRSTNGTALNGQELPPCGAVPLPLGQTSTIALAANQAPGGVLALSATANPCPNRADGRPCPVRNLCAGGVTASLTLRRGDEAPEAYALVWRCVSLAPFFPDLADALIYREDDRFILCRADGALRTLSPGNLLDAPDGRIAVRDFHQVWL